ncbi:hypothetical protein [Legionella parisiensis]|uniref:Fe-S protein n=1 Tax=Legionella parisiensis TaxID=45071 RepID=A0A1E5JMY9_9GAMM|nr:hypothetical protein [Legionella parisiensis]KTD42285.1 Fe-S protein [Legionella parisiensis]OEH45840.1 hypothetical protein lpari_03159 [Legionella parisiensis]STX72355.1 Fe-S protein [Legionella parisiensis]
MHLRLLFLLSFFAHAALASPWFTGPLLAPAGKTIPAGHINFEPYAFYSGYPKGFRNFEVLPILSIGMLSFVDLQTSLPYDVSWDDRQHGNGIGDYSLALGVQILRQKENSWLPDLRVVVQEVFPTGRFENLDPQRLGTDQTGLGAYQTYLGFNFQKLIQFHNGRYLRTRLSLVGARFSEITVDNVNVFGGATGTRGIVKLDNSYSADLAFEYTLTQHWVPVFEALYVHSPGSQFDGNPGLTPGGALAGIGGKANEQVSLAPALEYNFNSNLGLIGGVWFSVTGPHAAKFVTGALALNCYF